MSSENDILRIVYRDFNARNIDAVISRMHPQVEWPNGMEGGYVHGKDEVHDYWTRQFMTLDPHVEPVRIERDEVGNWVVEVHQIVQDKKGNLLRDATVYHTYQFRDGLIARMDIGQESVQTGKNQ